MLGEKSLVGRSSLFLRGEVWTVLTTPTQLSASHFKRFWESDKCGAVFWSIDDLPACFCMGRYLCLEPILPVATPVATLWRSTCKPYGHCSAVSMVCMQRTWWKGEGEVGGGKVCIETVPAQPESRWHDADCFCHVRLVHYGTCMCDCGIQLTGLEKSAAIRPFATKKSRLASEIILLEDSLATESCRLADRLATKLFSKCTTPRRTERDRARCVAVFVGPRCKGVGRSGPVDRVWE